MKEKLNEYYQQFKSNKLFKKTMKSYFFIACMIFLAYALVIVISVSRAGIKQMTAAEQKMLSQAETTNDFILKNINSVAGTVFEKETIGIDAMTKPYSPELSTKVSDLVSEIKTRSNTIDKVYFFNLKDNFIYTSDSPVCTSEDFPDKELLEMINNSSHYLINQPHVLKYESSDGKITEENSIVSLYKYSNTSCMAVIINSKLFDSMVNTDSKNPNLSMTIATNDGIVLSSTKTSNFKADLSNDKTYRRIESSPNEDGYFSSGGIVYSYRKSNTLNTIYISEFKSSSVIVSYSWQFSIIILFTMLLLLLYFISSMQISLSIFRPFKKLRTDVYSILGIKSDLSNIDQGSDRDLSLLTKNLENIKNKYDSMSETENLYSEAKRNELVYNILTGSYNYDENEIQAYNINFKFPYITIVIFRLDNTNLIEKSNIGLIRYGIANAGTEIFITDNSSSYNTTFSNEYDVAFIINHEDSIFDKKYIQMLQTYIRNAFSITVSAAYATAKYDSDSAVELYQKVNNSLQYRIVYGHNSIIDCQSLSPINHGDYPAKIEKAILREINQKNKDGILKYIDEFILAIKSTAYSDIIIHSGMLIMAIESHNDSFENNKASSDIISTKLMKAETLDDIKNIILSKCNEFLIANSTEKNDNKYILIANSIEEYVNDHYTDANLSIDTIASYVNKSVNYTRSIFKQNKGISISDYITKKRFDEVCRLLVETNLTAQSISQKTGMSSGSYFYTAFKKYTGYTPEQYRKKNM